MRLRDKKRELRIAMYDFQAWVDSHDPTHEYHTDRVAAQMAAAALAVYEEDQEKRRAVGKSGG